MTNTIVAISEFKTIPNLVGAPFKDFQKKIKTIRVTECQLPKNPKYLNAIAKNYMLLADNDLTNIDGHSMSEIVALMKPDIDEFISIGEQFKLVIDITYFPNIIIYLDTRKPDPNDPQNQFQRNAYNLWKAFNIDKDHSKLPTLVVNAVINGTALCAPPYK